MSVRRQMLIAAAAGVAVTVLFFVLLLSPKLSQIAEVRDDVQAAQDEEQLLRANLARLEEVRENAPRTRAKLARVSDLLPSEPQLPTFIRLVQEAALREGVDLVSISPGTPAAVEGNDGVQTIDVGIVVIGSFHPLENFLARLENLRRLLKVQSIAITRQSGDEVPGLILLNGQISMRMYVVTDDAGASSSSPGSSS